MRKDKDLETICAVSTPSGVGGISVIRVSGTHATSISRALCSFLPEKLETHRAYYGFLRSLDDDQEIDEVVATFFQKGRSFTGEDTVELSCHGSPAIVKKILTELVNGGARPAERGEFTYRAFMNGRLDLVQAESVLALIESQSQQSARQALRQLQGNLSKELEALESDLIWCLAHIEASIDFSTEGLDVVDPHELGDKISKIEIRLRKLVDSFAKGRVLRDGFQLVLTGIPNVGKSSLLNLLVEEDRAIVTDVPGTTRDLVEASFMCGGFKVNAVDTAGLRQATDQVEKIGIERSYAAQKGADGIFFVFDSSQSLSQDELNELASLDLERTYLIGNKRDQGLVSVEDRIAAVSSQIRGCTALQNLQGIDNLLKERVHIISALDKTDGEALKEVLEKRFHESQFEDQAVISQARHWENLNHSLDKVRDSKSMIANSLSPELVALDLKDALLRVQETIGKRFDDQIMDRVFKEFCIGK